MMDFIIIILIILGAMVMFLSITETKDLVTFIKDNQYKKRWNQLFYLMIFFLFGYVFVILLLIFKLYSVILFITGIIFLFGSGFVLLVVNTGLLTMKNLVKVNQDLLRAKSLEFELEKAKQTEQAILASKIDFLNKISEKIKNPIKEIQENNQLLADSNLNSKQNELIINIQENTDNLFLIVNDLLDFSKIESGELILATEEFDLKNCLEQVIELMLPPAKNKGLKLSYYMRYDTPITIIKTDSNRLRQVLLNLVSNAIKFTEEGEIIISVKYLSKNLLMFSVKDTGIGIPEKSLNLLFQPFTEMESSSKKQLKGTGLGLAICKELTQLMGGNIWVESQIGVGSTFFFTVRA
jgi:signal transduction histidine kinase